LYNRPQGQIVFGIVGEEEKTGRKGKQEPAVKKHLSTELNLGGISGSLRSLCKL
jgi:hypothetical protein